MEEETKAILAGLGLPMRIVGGVVFIIVGGFRFFSNQDAFGSGVVVLIGLGLAIWGVVDSYKVAAKQSLWFERRQNLLVAYSSIAMILLIASLFIFVVNDGVIFQEFKAGWADIFADPEETETPAPTETQEIEDTPVPPTATPITAVPENSGLSGLGDFLVAYFETVNNASDPKDIEGNFDHLSFALQEFSGHKAENYAGFWWMHQVLYGITVCPENTAWVELTYFDRGNNFTTLWQYTFDVIDYEWVFQTTALAGIAIYNGCQPPISNQPGE